LKLSVHRSGAGLRAFGTRLVRIRNMILIPGHCGSSILATVSNHTKFFQSTYVFSLCTLVLSCCIDVYVHITSSVHSLGTLQDDVIILIRLYDWQVARRELAYLIG
jgi:hypothetical protein